MKTKTRILVIIFSFFTNAISYSQQIGNGFATGLTTSDFTQPLKSGIYEINSLGIIPDESYSWQHLFVIRHSNQTNNHQLQLSSSYNENDRIFFRKLANSSNPAWNELATRGTNNFVGDQNISGNVGIGTTNPSNIQGWSRVLDVAGIHHSKILATSENALYKVGIFSHNENWYGGGGFIGTESNHSLHLITNYNVKMSILTNGNVGIGSLNPTNKLDVNGTIHSKEVKVDMNGWSDFVFKKEYNLPTLEEVEKHIAEKGHLENIPSEDEVLKNGISLGEMNAKLLQKIEELTLYMIEMKKENEIVKNENSLMKKNQIELEKRILKIENK